MTFAAATPPRRLAPDQEQKLVAFARALVDQNRARVIVPPQKPAPGYWFGGGNLVAAPDGRLFLTGRYRNHGDSRSGLAAGERGLELALFQSADRGRSFQKVLQFSKQDLSQPGRAVLSIEGSALRFIEQGVELYVSSEKAGIGYPPGVESFLKPGCGIWTIERLAAGSIEDLRQAQPVTVLSSPDPEYLHLKDPRIYIPAGSQPVRRAPEAKTPFPPVPAAGKGQGAIASAVLMYCSHPFSWSSSNTEFALMGPTAGSLEAMRHGMLPRGTTWDVAISRGTCLLDVPPVGAFGERQVTLLFYDGGECVRDLAEHSAAIQRPRGYSCEELGGLAYCLDGDFGTFHRLSPNLPLFVSPHGTGCSRYVDVLATPDGFHVTWQQSQPDRSQPLVANFVDRELVDPLLGV